MVTPDEIGRIGVFECLDTADRERVCRVAADISLSAGEFAAHEGDERALFAVLDGQIEATRMVDGIHRPIGVRQPGRALRRGAGHARHGLPGRFPRRRGVAGDADRAAPLPRARIGDAVDRRRGRASWRRTASAAPAACRASRPRPRSHARSCSATAGTATARSCAASSTATGSRSDGCSPTSRRRPRSGGATCRPRATTPLSGSSTGRRWCARSCAGWPSCSRSRPSRTQRSTTP